MAMSSCGSYPSNCRQAGDTRRYEDIVSLLGYAGGHEQAVRITTTPPPT